MESEPIPNVGANSKVAVFVHGAGGGGWEWNSWAPVFERNGWLCVKPDLIPARGGLERTQFRDYLRQVERWSSRRSHSQLVLIGASMGGILALRASQKLRPDALVLVNSVGPYGITRLMSKRYPAIVEWSNGTLSESRVSMPDSDPESIRFAHRHWRDESGTVLRGISMGIRITAPKCPLLVLVGDQDKDIPLGIGKDIARRFTGDFKVFHGMSHVGPLLGKQSYEVAEYAAAWIERQRR